MAATIASTFYNEATIDTDLARKRGVAKWEGMLNLGTYATSGVAPPAYTAFANNGEVTAIERITIHGSSNDLVNYAQHEPVTDLILSYIRATDLETANAADLTAETAWVHATVILTMSEG